MRRLPRCGVDNDYPIFVLPVGRGVALHGADADAVVSTIAEILGVGDELRRFGDEKVHRSGADVLESREHPILKRRPRKLRVGSVQLESAPRMFGGDLLQYLASAQRRQLEVGPFL